MARPEGRIISFWVWCFIGLLFLFGVLWEFMDCCFATSPGKIKTRRNGGSFLQRDLWSDLNTIDQHDNRLDLHSLLKLVHQRISQAPPPSASKRTSIRVWRPTTWWFQKRLRIMARLQRRPNPERCRNRDRQ